MEESTYSTPDLLVLPAVWMSSCSQAVGVGVSGGLVSVPCPLRFPGTPCFPGLSPSHRNPMELHRSHLLAVLR